MGSRRSSIDPERLRDIRVEAMAQRTVGAWWNAQRFDPAVAQQVREELPELAEALEELAVMVMPKGVSGTPFSS